ncbi:MAG: glycosyltransferase [Mariprofundus sp.]|nr:glycosyltransferase [Mariprofundus sp.]
MPAYNADQFVNTAVQSCMAQSWTNWELIIVNDGSTDGTKDTLDRIDDSRIHVLHQSNKGVSSARNAALELAMGEYITFLDADDAIPPKSLEVRAVFLQENPEVDIVDGVISVRDATLQEEQRRYRPYYSGKLLPRLLKLDDCVFFGPFYMVRRSRLGGTRFAEGMTHAEDLRFFIEMADRNAIEYGHVNELVYLYRKSESSAMANMEGLERGYLQLLIAIRGLAGVSTFSLTLLRLKVAKILFLSWGNRAQWRQAFSSVWHVINAKVHSR